MSATEEAPRCPPANLGFSITIASGKRPFFSHFFTNICTPLASDKMGINAVAG